MERHCSNAMAVAEYLARHPKVAKVIYPGLQSHPQHVLAEQQMDAPGGMVTAFLKGGLDEARRFLERVEVFALAESLGGVESPIEHPAIMTHAPIPPRSEEHTSELQSLMRTPYAVFCLKKKKT